MPYHVFKFLLIMNSPLFRVVSHRCDNCIHCGYRWDWRAYVVENNHSIQVSEHSLQIFKTSLI